MQATQSQERQKILASITAGIEIVTKTNLVYYLVTGHTLNTSLYTTGYAKNTSLNYVNSQVNKLVYFIESVYE